MIGGIVKEIVKMTGNAMTMFPNLDPSFYVEGDRDLINMMNNIYMSNITINQSAWAEADLDLRFKAGDQSVLSDIYGAGAAPFRKRQFTFNRIRRIINMISGYQRQHRKQTAVTPLHPKDQQTADQFSKLLYHINTHSHVLETISEAFEGALTTGMSLLATWVNFQNDVVNGDIEVDHVPSSSFLIDPYFKKMDFSDCNNIWSRKYLSRNQVEALLPGREKDIANIRGIGSRDGKFQFMCEAYNYGQQDLYIYDELWYLDTRQQIMLIDTETGESSEWRGKDEDLQDFLHIYPQIIKITQPTPTVKLAIVCQGRVLYNGPNPLGIDNYPYVPVWCFYEPQITNFTLRSTGIVRNLRDAQFLFNRARVNMLDIQESQINSGWKYKENALVNPKDVFLTGQGKGLALKAEAQMTDVERIEPPNVPQSMIQIAEFLANELNQISGINEELLGSAEDDKAGILSMLRQGAGLTTLQGVFDHLDFSQKLLGTIHMKIVQANFTPGKVQRILDEQPSEQFYNRAFSKYDAIVEEASLTSTQKQLSFKTAIYLREIGIPIPTSFLIENMNVPDKDKLVKEIQATEQQKAQMEQQMAEMQIKQLQVDNETKLAYADSQKALASERINKTKLDAAVSAERLQRADSDRTTSLLNLVKLAKEIKGMDIDHIERSIAIVQQIGNEEGLSDTKGQVQEIMNQVQTPAPTTVPNAPMPSDQGMTGNPFPQQQTQEI